MSRDSRWHRLLLRLFPGEFRDEYEREMLEGWSFRERQHRRAFWPQALADALRSAPAEHLVALRLDVVAALRSMKAEPLFTLSLIAIMAAGIGANTAIFSLLRAGLFHSVPYPEPGRLVAISAVVKGKEGDLRWVPPVDVEAMRPALQSLDALAAVGGPGLTIRINDIPERHFGARLAGPLFESLGVRTIFGRLPYAEDERPGAAPVVLLDYNFWRDRFGSNPAVVGSALVIDGMAHNIIGVLDEKFRFPLTFSAWIPLPVNSAWWRERSLASDYTLFLVGRLAPGASPASAQAELEARLKPLARDYPETHTGRGFVVRPFREMIVAGFRPALFAFQCAVGLLLLIGCANVAHLLLARAASRRSEMAVRAALGASPRRLARQSVTEAMVLALVGGGAGVAAAYWMIRLLVLYIPSGLQFDNWLVSPGDIRLDPLALAFCFGVSIATGLLFGAAPTSRASRVQAGEVMKASSRGTTGPRGAHQWLVGGQTALATTLLIGAILLTQTIVRLQSESLGFDVRGLVRARIASNPDRVRTGERERQFSAEVIDRVCRLNGVRSAAMASWLPLGGPRNRVFYRAGTSAGAAPAARPDAYLRVVTPGYFSTVGTAILRGRPIEAGDHQTAPTAVVISESVARRNWPDADPIGQRIELDQSGATVAAMVTGVAADVRAFGPADPVTPTVYVSSLQAPWDRIELREIAMRMLPGAAAPTAALRESLAALDSEMPVYLVGPMDRAVENTIGQPQFAADLLSIFAITAVLLAVIGLYGAVSYQVARQRREVGVRIALGATHADVIGHVLRNALGVSVAGVLAGTVFSFALWQVLAKAVHGIEPLNAIATGTAASALIATSVLAGLVPAFHASRVDPVEALRQS